MVIKKHFFHIFCAFLLSSSLCLGQAKQFVITKNADTKRVSTNTLKERIGEETKRAFESTTLLTRQCGLLHESLADVQLAVVTPQDQKNNIALAHKSAGGFLQQIAQLQSRFVKVIEQLLDNARPFKRAARNDLTQALLCMQSAAGTLSLQLQQLEQCNMCCSKKKINKLQVEQTTKMLSCNLDRLKIVQDELQKTVCLKQG